jgi:phage replication-related protein YjqB (UPF0714/DUF867 family)
MDKYANYKELSAHQQIGKDYTIHIQYALPDIVILAIHGGRIEAGTSEIARGIAGERWSFYDFRGKKKKNNRDLHITSTCFDEPRALNLVAHASRVVTVHGTKGDKPFVYLGGRDEALLKKTRLYLLDASFPVGVTPGRLKGTDPKNIVNRGARGKGLQIELTRGMRSELFKNLSWSGRREPSPRFQPFVEAIRSAIHSLPKKKRPD